MKTYKIDGIQITEEQRLELNRQAEAKSKGRFRPEPGQNYWCIDSMGFEADGVYADDEIDQYYLLTGNCFQTKEEATAYKEYQLALGRVNHAILDANDGWVPDWEDKSQTKYFLYLNTSGWDVDWEIPSITISHETELGIFRVSNSGITIRGIIKTHAEDLETIRKYRQSVGW
jgi:hypothetical protein